MGRMEALLQPGGRMICSDFHPFQKVADILGFQTPAMDYFSTAIVEGEMVHARVYPPEIRAGFPKCRLRRYTLSEIINAVPEAERIAAFTAGLGRLCMRGVPARLVRSSARYARRSGRGMHRAEPRSGRRVEYAIRHVL